VPESLNKFRVYLLFYTALVSVVFTVASLYWVNRWVRERVFNCYRVGLLHSDFNGVWYRFFNCHRDGPLHSDFDWVRDWPLNFVRDWLLYCHRVWLWDSYWIRSINRDLNRNGKRPLYRVRNWFWYGYWDFLENCHWVWFWYWHRVGTVNRYVDGIRHRLSYRVRNGFFYWHWVWFGHVHCEGTVNGYLDFDRIRSVNWDSDWDFDVNRVWLGDWDLDVDWIRLRDWNSLLDKHWIRLGNMNWVGLGYRNSDFVRNRNVFLYRHNYRIWSVYRDLNRDWHILNDRVRHGFFNRHRNSDGPVNWDTDGIRDGLLDSDRYDFLYWDLNRIGLRHWDGDLFGVCVRLQQQAMSVAIKRRRRHQSVTEAASCQGTKFSKSIQPVAVTQVKESPLFLGR
jgi:hypothetical protein